MYKKFAHQVPTLGFCASLWLAEYLPWPELEKSRLPIKSECRSGAEPAARSGDLHASAQCKRAEHRARRVDVLKANVPNLEGRGQGARVSRSV